MSPCKQCGANLPDDARFCLQCGAAVDQQPQPVTDSGAPLDFVQPALAGGMFLGVLSSLPFVGLGNCLCCMWMQGGGAIASLLLAKQRPSGINLGDGAFAGVLSGVFGAVIGTIVSIPVRLIQTRYFDPEAVEEMLNDIPGLEGPMRDLMLRMASEISATTLTVTFFTNLLLYSLFAMIGGILAIAILNKKKGAGISPRPDAT